MGHRSFINESELRDLAMDIIKYADDINHILNSFDDRFYDLRLYYEGKAYNELKKFYSSVRKQYPIVQQNIISYSDDFIALIRKMNDGTKTIGKMFEEYTVDTKKKAADVNNNFLRGN